MGAADTLAFAEEVARLAGELIARQRESLELSFKRGVELLTSADLHSDRLIRARIQEKFPDHAILSEELAPELKEPERLRGPLWIVDPIDGTVNYAHGLPQVAVSIAFAEGGKLQAGVVHCPFMGETYGASRGGGAHLNGQPLRASECAALDQALVATGFPYERQRRRALFARARQVLLHCRDLRRSGSAAVDLCWVAAGRLDGYYETLNAWDVAAGKLIALEAGARAGHLEEQRDALPGELSGHELLVAAPGVYEDLAALLRAAHEEEGQKR